MQQKIHQILVGAKSTGGRLPAIGDRIASQIHEQSYDALIELGGVCGIWKRLQRKWVSCGYVRS